MIHFCRDKAWTPAMNWTGRETTIGLLSFRGSRSHPIAERRTVRTAAPSVLFGKGMKRTRTRVYAAAIGKTKRNLLEAALFFVHRAFCLSLKRCRNFPGSRQ